MPATRRERNVEKNAEWLRNNDDHTREWLGAVSAVVVFLVLSVAGVPSSTVLPIAIGLGALVAGFIVRRRRLQNVPDAQSDPARHSGH